MIVAINVMGYDEMDEISASLGLDAAAEYAAKHGLVIVGERDETGKVVYWFERRHKHDHK